jgi:glycogen operon protein
MTSPHYRTTPGESFPAGASVNASGVNFVVFSQRASAVTLILYGGERDRTPLQTIDLDPVANRTFYFWHVHVEGATAGLWYTWRAAGPADSANGLRFDERRELLDPWARLVSDALWDRETASRSPGVHVGFRAQVVADEPYDWEDDQPLNHAPEDSVTYELHVRGFTRHPNAQVSEPGTFSGLIEKIPYLVELGVTDVELMPIMAFDTQDLPASGTALGLVNFWGYSPYGFFALHPAYASTRDARREFRDLVKALHRAGIGVILDVVFNHTAEGGAEGPTIHFKGLANEIFYHLDPSNRRRYRDFSGCGNTLNCNHPVVAQFLLRCLEYWVREMHVDGFRFDLASVLARGEDGQPMYHAPVLWNIEFSEVLSGARLIAEAWDAGGLYQVGDFPGYRWAEWNGRYRDSIRRFVRGDAGLLGEVASRIAGSSDLYAPTNRLPTNSVNFITCHDGFTLLDLVSYEERRNEANGESNRDGNAHNFGWNCGIEGPTRDASVLELRHRQARNLVAILLLSQGPPMLLAGDEMLRTQAGNNNAYCQDNEVSWIDWSLTERNADFLRFVREMIRFRKRHASLRRRRFLNGGSARGTALPDIRWYSPEGETPDWSNADARALAFLLAPQEAGEPPLFVMINMHAASVTMRIPALAGRTWHRAVDTALAPALDIVEPQAQRPLRNSNCRLAGHSIIVLESHLSEPAA